MKCTHLSLKAVVVVAAIVRLIVEVTGCCMLVFAEAMVGIHMLGLASNQGASGLTTFLAKSLQT